MDNENKINEDKNKLVKSFITENVAEKYEKPKLYDLQKEFEKTKKNKQTFLWVMVFSFIAIIIIITIIFNIYIENKRRLTTFKIPEFQEINLKDLLDTAKKLQEKLDAAKEELNALKEEKNLKIQSIKDKISNDIQLVLVKNISKYQKDREVKNLKRERDKLIKEVNDKYDPLIAQKEQEIAEIQKELDKYDSRLNAQVKEAQKQLERYKELSALEMEKIKDLYEIKIKKLTQNYETRIDNLKEYYQEYTSILENKYNPVFKDKNVKKILNEKSKIEIPENYSKFENISILENDNIINSEDKEYIENNFNDILALTKRLGEIPYKNSVPIAINKILEKVKYLDYKYNTILITADNVLSEKNEIIFNIKKENSMLNQVVSTIQSSLDFYLTKIKEDGIIVSKNDDNSYFVYFKDGLEVVDNQPVYVLRNFNIIAKGTIRKSDNYYYITVDKVINDETIYPFDLIVLSYNY